MLFSFVSMVDGRSRPAGVPWGAGPGTRVRRAALGDVGQLGVKDFERAGSPVGSPISQAAKRGLGAPDVGQFTRGKVIQDSERSPSRGGIRRRPASAVVAGRVSEYQNQESTQAGGGVDPRSQARLAMNRTFDTVRDVGRGSFGSATELRHKASGRRYVLKRIRLARQSGAMRRNSAFEVEMARNLRHPFVVRTRGTWTEVGGSQLCILMDCYQRGDLMKTLIEYAGSGKRFKEDTLKLWAVQLLVAMEYLHSERVLHRDIKTSNVFLNEQGGVELGDFGLAQRLEHGEKEAAQVGTPMYMCPARFSGVPYDYKSDVWSLGCVLYELSAHQSPFAAFNVEGVRAKVEKVSPKPLPKCYSRDWSNFVRRMLKKVPEERPSVADLLRTPCLQDVLKKVRAYLATSSAALVDDAERFWYNPGDQSAQTVDRPLAARPFSATAPKVEVAKEDFRSRPRPSTASYPSRQQRKQPLSPGRAVSEVRPQTPKSWSDPLVYELAESSDENVIPIDDDDEDSENDGPEHYAAVGAQEGSRAAARVPPHPANSVSLSRNSGKESPSPQATPRSLPDSFRQPTLEEFKFSVEKKPVDKDTNAALLSHAEALRSQLEAARGALAEARNLYRRSKFPQLGELLEAFHTNLVRQKRNAEATP